MFYHITSEEEAARRRLKLYLTRRFLARPSVRLDAQLFEKLRDEA